MKNTFATICLFLIVVVSNGQSDTARIFKPFKLDLSLGYGLPLGGPSGIRAGVVFAIEPKYALSDKFTLGLRWEGASLVRVFENNAGTSIDGDGQANSSFTLTGDYFFTTEKFRPFIGGGPGYFGVANVNIENEEITFDTNYAFKVGYMFRVGFEVRHFRLGMEYNGVGSTDTSPFNNYLSLKVGGFFGGGRIK